MIANVQKFSIPAEATGDYVLPRPLNVNAHIMIVVPKLYGRLELGPDLIILQLPGGESQTEYHVVHEERPHDELQEEGK